MEQIFKLMTTAMFPALIKFTYTEDGITKHLRLVNNTVDMVYDGETYIAASFKYNPPKNSDRKMGNGTLSISCIDQSMIVLIRSLKARATAKVTAAFYYDEDNHLYFEPIDEWTFKLSTVSWNESVAQWTMLYDDRMDIQFPSVKMNSLLCPGIG
jgi:hypothetical protein